MISQASVVSFLNIFLIAIPLILLVNNKRILKPNNILNSNLKCDDLSGKLLLNNFLSFQRLQRHYYNKGNTQKLKKNI